jgi:HK97 family phage prohead protease
VVETPYDMGPYDEVIARGAFQDTLANRPDVQLLVNHENLPLARTSILPGQPGHLSLSEDYNGLHVVAQLDRSDPDAVMLVRKIRSGLLDQMSVVGRRDAANDQGGRHQPR